MPPPIFKTGILKLDDLAAGMELYGTVLNVVDFGAFVDIGLHDSGLVHISQLANRYIRDPHEVASVGDIVKVWVLEIDKTRRRVSLTMIPPGSKRLGAGGPIAWRPIAGRKGRRATERWPAAWRPTSVAPRSAPARPGGPPVAQPAAAGDSAAAGTVSTDAAVSAGIATTDAPSTSSIAARSDSPPRPPHGKRPYGGPPQGRPSQGRPSQGRPSRGPDQGKPAYRPPPPKPKPLIPITDAMKKGKEPLRTFGDLKQFFEIKTEPPAEKAVEKPAAQAAESPAVQPAIEEIKPAEDAS